MIDVTSKAPDRWTATRGDAVVGRLRLFVRPDDRCYAVFGGCVPEAYGPLLDAGVRDFGRDVYAEADENDTGLRDELTRHGFKVGRREHVYSLPTRPVGANVTPPDGFGLISAAGADLGRFSDLDQALRRDVPGVGEWRNDPEAFRRETFDDPQFDPATYLIAVDGVTGGYAGLVRVWIRPSGPRLGLIGVLPAYRGRGLARALIARVLGVLDERGEAHAVCEVDETNGASNALMAGFGASRIGGNVELVRRPR